jgi:sulfhydrogenase subunit gamma (sulfur reductase)
VDTNAYAPRVAVIKAVKDEAEGIKTFRLELRDGDTGAFSHRPGQFVELTVFGVGEAPISISSSPAERDWLELTVASVGEVTEALHDKQEDQLVGIRGPYGNGFPLDDVGDRHLVFVAGGIGLAPLRSVVNQVLAERARFGRVTVLYGARRPDLLCFRAELEEWNRAPNTEVLLTVDAPEDGWVGEVGPVTVLLPRVEMDVGKSVAFVCGPPVMIRYAVEGLLGLGFAEQDIVTSLERRMECGVGKCGHCSVGKAHVCTDGPVFDYARLKELKEGF